MKQSLKIVLAFLWLVALSNAAHAASWQLMTIWAPGFCATSQPGVPLCQGVNATADHLLTWQLKSPQGQCPDTGRTAATITLGKADGAYLAVLGKTDWDEHWRQYGSCSGIAADHYLSTNADMAKMISHTSLGKLLKENKGKLIFKEQLLTALRYDYFIGADRKATLVCRQNYLIGVWFYPRDWSELFVNTEQGGMLDSKPPKIAVPAESECSDQVQL